MDLCFPLLGVILAFLAIVEHGDAATCTITKYDANTIKSAKSSCPTITISGLEVPAGQTLDLSNLKSGTKVVFAGTITWGYKEWQGPLVKVSGSNIEVSGASGHVLDGRGKLWWDGKGGNGGKKKPKFFSATLSNSKILNLNVRNSPVHIFSISGCKGLLVQGINIDNSAGDSGGGHNTDAFDVGNSNDVTIQKSTIKNQDDCLAINSGTKITFANNVCSGGHGISIGSVGGRSNNVVKTVRVTGCKISNSQNGVRIKTVYGATGSVSDVVYKDITLSNISKYGIVVEGDYKNGGPTGTPTEGVPITGLTIQNVKGSVASGGTNVYILVKGAYNWKFSGISVSGGGKKKACSGIPSGAGIYC